MNFSEYMPVNHEGKYWTGDIPLFIANLAYYRYKPRLVQGRIHLSEERYSEGHQEIIPLIQAAGLRHYIHLQPYVLEPEMTLTVGLYPKSKRYADQKEAIGEVLSTRVKGWHPRPLGNAQAWYYPADETILLWECFLDRQARENQPLTKDRHMPKLWNAFEHWLGQQFPKATRLVTPFNDPIAKSIEEYQSFLRSLGYTPVSKGAFGKELTSKMEKS